MGGIVIDIWEKSNFFRAIWITKRCQKRNFCSGGALKAPPLMVGLRISTYHALSPQPPPRLSAKLHEIIDNIRKIRGFIFECWIKTAEQFQII